MNEETSSAINKISAATQPANHPNTGAILFSFPSWTVEFTLGVRHGHRIL